MGANLSVVTVGVLLYLLIWYGVNGIGGKHYWWISELIEWALLIVSVSGALQAFWCLRFGSKRQKLLCVVPMVILIWVAGWLLCSLDILLKVVPG
ncbi:MAG: hypothetical protein WD847_07625 [Pirellulales bacterium]